MKNILIYGASGHAKMVVDIIHKTKSYNIVGFIDAYKCVGTVVRDYPILGSLNNLEYLVQKFDVNGIIIAIGDNHDRKSAYHEIRSIIPKIKFVSAIHPSACIADDVKIPEGTVIMAGGIVNANAKLGKGCIINTKASLGHESYMKDFASLSSGATVGGNVKIGTCSAICLGASIINNVEIGNHTVIGAGALVVKSIGDLKQAIGVPVRVIKDRKIDSKYLMRTTA